MPQSMKTWTFQPAVKLGQLHDAKANLRVHYRNGQVGFTPAEVPAAPGH
ncbi:hypothetical protein [Janthinobacterium agaricidamnosum]|nr:hypothetical protein [Janthinobacterium agaricidamnosum]